MTLDEFFDGWDESRRIFDVLYAAIVATGEIEMTAGLAPPHDNPYFP